MKKQKSALTAVIQKSIILFAFGLTVYVMLHVFTHLKANSVHDVVKENMLDSYAEQIEYFGYFIGSKKTSSVGNLDYYFDDPSIVGIIGYKWFFDYDDRTWVEENCGGFPRFDSDDVSLIKYYGELTPGEIKGHTGYYTTVIEAFPLEIALDTDYPIHYLISIMGLVFILVIATSSIVVYNKSRIDTNTAENVLIKGLSYDLKEPLDSLKASAIAWKQADESEKKAMSQSVISDVSRMDMVIKRQLRLRDLRSGNIDLRAEEIDMQYMVKKTVDELRSVFLKRNIDVVEKYESGVEHIVNVDPQLIELVISNMLLVAADNTKKQIVVEVCSEKNSKNDDYVCFMVSSSGLLFKDFVENDVWEVVRDFDKKRTESYGSRGVGLAPLVPILKAHNAKYGNNGSGRVPCFWIDLKKVDDE